MHESKTYVAKVVSGTAKLHLMSGPYVRTLVTGAVSANVQGKDVFVTMANGGVRIYDVSGRYRRTV